MSNRLLAAVLFAVAGAPGWLAVADSLGGLSVSYLVGYTLAGVIASGIAGALSAPVLASEAVRGAPLRKGAVLGVFVSVLGVFVSVLGVALGSAVVAVAAAGLSLDLAAAFAVSLGSILFALFPWLGLGAAAGALFYALRRSPVLGAG